MTSASAFTRDANFVPITNLGLQASKAITYSALTTGATGTTTLFTVTGTVACNVFAVCSTDLTGSGTLEVGTATSTATLCDQQAATAIDNHEIWHNAIIAVGGQVGGSAHIINEDVIQTIATNTVTAGVLTFYCLWTPISTDGNVVAT